MNRYRNNFHNEIWESVYVDLARNLYKMKTHVGTTLWVNELQLRECFTKVDELPDNFVVLKPGEVWDTTPKKMPFPKYEKGVHKETADNASFPRHKDQVIDQMNAEPKCTCGVDAIGGGVHSPWCDKA